MSCCDHNAPPTGCNQGRDCPLRTRRITEGESAEAARLMDVARMADARRVVRPQVNPTWPPPERTQDDTANLIPTEEGNVWFAGNEPDGMFDDVDEWPPLTRREIVIISGITACIVVPWLVVIAAGIGYVLERAAA